MQLKILYDQLLDEYKNSFSKSPLEALKEVKPLKIPVDYFQFYKSISSVYSSKIEGEDIDFDSYFKHKFLNVGYKQSYIQKADDLYSAYEFIDSKELTIDNVKKAHSLITQNLLPEELQGEFRNNPMFVINSDDNIEYIACSPFQVQEEIDKLFDDIEILLESDLDEFEIFYYASLVHLVFVKIHPFQDGNGRISRLLEKWFLKEKLGTVATSIQLEKNYYENLQDYYSNIKKIGLEFEELDYSKSLDFLLMTGQGIK